MKRAMIILVNAVLVLVIVGLITATWMPVIYNSQWFQTNHWVRVHLLHESGDGSGSNDAGNRAIKPG